MSLKAMGVTFGYPGVRRNVLHKADIEVRRGEVMSLRGRNGSGKTTLIHLLVGMMAPRRGLISCDGRETFLPAEAGIALIPASPDDYLVGGTVAEEIALGPENAGWGTAKICKAVGRALKMYNLKPLAERDADGLSEGQRRMVVLASALAMEPRYLLIDEPLRGLDAGSRATVGSVVFKAANRGCGVLLASAGEPAGVDVGRRAWLYEGRVDEVEPRNAKNGVAEPGNVKYDSPPALHRRHGKQKNVGASTTDGTGLEARNICYSYPDGQQGGAGFRLRDLNVYLHPGEIVALTGENGSGKTTLLSLLAGVLPPSGGLVWLDGAPLSRKKSGSRERSVIGMCPQRPADILHRDTVREEVSFVLKMRRVPDYDQRVNSTLKALGITRLAERDTLRLSSGERRLVAIACLLALRPNYLLADEPFGGLDRTASLRVARALTVFAGRGGGVIISSSVVGGLPLRFDRTVVLEEGVVIHDGPQRATGNEGSHECGEEVV